MLCFDFSETDELKSFTKQVNFYHLFLGCLNLVGLGIGLAGVFGFQKNTYLGCAPDGLQWTYVKNLGNLFEFAHTLYIILQCVLCLKVIYLIPKSYGIFDSDIDSLIKLDQE